MQHCANKCVRTFEVSIKMNNSQEVSRTIIIRRKFETLPVIFSLTNDRLLLLALYYYISPFAVRIYFFTLHFWKFFNAHIINYAMENRH